VGIGKVEDLFAGRGLTKSLHTASNEEGVECAIRELEALEDGLILLNLCDFDTLYGHRNDPRGFAQALEAFDKRVPLLGAHLREDDLCIITGDHGNDPTTASTDHSREYVPLLITGPRIHPVDLGTRLTLADLGQTLAEAFRVGRLKSGDSFFKDLRCLPGP
jgi:phosphopentomutase